MMGFPAETVTVNKAKKSGISLRLRISGIINCSNKIIVKTINETNRFLQGISSCTFRIHKAYRFNKKYKASLTVEAAIVFPMFLLAVLQLLSLLNIFRNYSEKSMSLYESCKSLTEYSYISEDLPLNTEYIDLMDYYKETPTVALVRKNIWCLARARVKVWTGYDNTQNGGQEKCVYITDNQEVYHTKLHCSYLDMDIIELSKEEAEGGRISSGNEVSACGFCVNYENYTGKYYATKEGGHYHYDIECTSLIRRIRMVLKEDAGNLPVCSRCGGGDK